MVQTGVRRPSDEPAAGRRIGKGRGASSRHRPARAYKARLGGSSGSPVPGLWWGVPVAGRGVGGGGGSVVLPIQGVTRAGAGADCPLGSGGWAQPPPYLGAKLGPRGDPGAKLAFC